MTVAAVSDDVIVESYCVESYAIVEALVESRERKRDVDWKGPGGARDLLDFVVGRVICR
jgi:hypothetical protein